MPKAWFIAATWTARALSITERYAVAVPDSGQAAAKLAALLELPRTKVAVEGPVPEAMYYRLGLVPGVAIRVGREPRER